MGKIRDAFDCLGSFQLLTEKNLRPRLIINELVKLIICCFQTDFSFSLKPKATRVITKAETPPRQFAVYNLKGNGKDKNLLRKP